MSSVGGWKVEARDSSLRSPPASNTVTGTPARTRLAAATRPTGPAPTMKTRSSRKRLRSGGDLFDLLDAGLGDDAAILGDLALVPSLDLIERHPHRLGAHLLEPGLHGRVPHRVGQLLAEPLQDRLRRPGRSEQRKPAALLVFRQAGFGCRRRVGNDRKVRIAGDRK